MREPEHIKEIHKIREQIAAEYDYDIKKYVEHLKEVEKKCKKVIRQVPVTK